MSYIHLITSFVLLVLAFIHFYWVLFGLKDVSAVIPTHPSNKEVISPGKWATATVGMVLLGFAFIFINKVFLFLENQWLDYGAIAIGILFLGRAIGDFNYVGFTKKVTTTQFSRMDTKYYSPLCLILSMLIFLAEFLD